MIYKTIYDLSQDIKYNLHKIPKDIDVVVGIPRSGLLAANLISLYLNKPLTDFEGFLEGRVFRGGERNKYSSEQFSKVLIVDDSICSGKALLKAKNQVNISTKKNLNIVYCAVYVKPTKKNLVDISLVALELPRLFEWNIFHHSTTSQSCIDIDGVLCVDPAETDNDDGEKYKSFIQDAVPYILPSVHINTLVTCRLEKYRESTARWLHNNNIEFDELIMLNLPDKASRLKWNKHGAFKAEVYRNREKCILFIESSWKQALEIHRLSGKDVYCIEANKFLTKTSCFKRKVATGLKKMRSKFKNFAHTYIKNK